VSGNKYRVEQDGQFLGHHSGHTPREAIKKAINNYGNFYNINEYGWFDLTKGKDTIHITGEK